MPVETPMSDLDPHCLLYIALEPGPGSGQRLAAALDVAEVSAVLVQPRRGDRLGAGEVKPLVDICKKAGVAVLIADDAALARTLKADGVHLTAGADLLGRLRDARGRLGTSALVGADPGVSRHEAMEVAEAGADYIAFAAPAAVRDRTSAIATRDDLVAWWADVFEIPCVAFDVQDAEEARRLAAASADFVVVTLADGAGEHEIVQRVAAFSEAVGAEYGS